jgi:arylsulfatase A-like enzyme
MHARAHAVSALTFRTFPRRALARYFAHQEIHAPDLKPPDSASIAACAGRNWTSPIGPEVTKLRGTLCSMASNLDASIGRFVDMLKAKNMWENTVLWLTTDK